MGKQKELCPHCGTEVSESALGGLCPKCLLESDNTPTVEIREGDGGPSRSGTRKGSTKVAAPAEEAPKQIGPYRILEPIGEGGMGQVYVAEQREPVRRRVAIKVIKPGMDSKEVLARFDAERQALALMDHPNVSRVLDAGMMGNGRPYFVMDLVVGHPITEFCDRNRLGIEDRLELFYQVCQGMQHAHQKGIIHRDIKPSNVIVTVNNSQPIPKVIDFGIAKAMGAELTQQTYFTFAGQIIGPPQYMSPEQAESHPSDIDTRSDIYSLGVMLYELLTGRTPLSKGDFKESGLEEMLRKIRETEAVKPSTVVSRLDESTVTSVSDQRSASARRLTHVLKGDLDWMVMKALDKDRSRRYETANAFAGDVRAYLRGETITATPPTIHYQMGKFMKRHKGPLVASSLITCSLIAGLVVSLWQADVARFEASKAKIAEATALENFEIAEREKKFAIEQQALAQAEREKAEAAKLAAEKARVAAEESEQRTIAALKKSEESQKAAEEALQDSENSKRVTEKALAELQESQKKLIASIEREEKVNILRSELQSRVGELLSFLRSEEMRVELQKKDLNGLDVVRSIDETISSTFPDVTRDAGLWVEDFRLSLKLGRASIYSLESSLTAAESNFTSALELLPRVAEENAVGQDESEPTILLQLSEIARMRGRYAKTLDLLRGVEGAVAEMEEGEAASQMEFELSLAKGETFQLLGKEQDAIAEILRADDLLGELDSESRSGRENRARLLGLAARFRGNPLGLDRMSVLSRNLDSDGLSSIGAKVDLLRYQLIKELVAIEHFARERKRADELNGGPVEEPLRKPWEKLKLTPEERKEREERARKESEMIGPMLALVQRIRESASDGLDRRFRVLELEAETVLATAYYRLDGKYLALSHYQRCFDRADALLRIDSEMIAPLNFQFRTGMAVADVYEDSEGGRRMSALENAYRGVLEIRSRGIDTDHLEEKVAGLIQRLVVATVFQFYSSMSSPSALEENSFFANEVTYFGGPSSGHEVLKDQIQYRKRYPHRLFAVKEISKLETLDGPAYFVTVLLDYWVADPKLKNDMDYDEPSGEIIQFIKFSFDESGRLRIVEINSGDK